MPSVTAGVNSVRWGRVRGAARRDDRRGLRCVELAGACAVLGVRNMAARGHQAERDDDAPDRAHA